MLRNSSGHFLSAIAIPIQQQLGPQEAEVVGVRKALSWVKQKNLTKVIVEIDSQLVFNALKNTSLITSPFAMLIIGLGIRADLFWPSILVGLNLNFYDPIQIGLRPHSG